MKYLLLDTTERRTLLARLGDMPAFLERSFGSLSAAEAAAAPQGVFSPLEHCWHLADLEREGFAVRIRRLLGEVEPSLPDFDGTRLANERDYRSRSLSAGLSLFRVAREENLAVLESLEEDQWGRAGVQEGLGPIMLCDLPSMMMEHDETHRTEIDTWLSSR